MAVSTIKPLFLAAALILLSPVSPAATEPAPLDSADLQKMRDLYSQLQDAQTILKWAEHSRANNEHLLPRLIEARESLLQYEKEQLAAPRARYEQWRQAAPDPNAAADLFTHLCRVFGSARLFADFNDPNKAALLRPGLVAMTRQLKTPIAANKQQFARYFDALAKIDPNDPNEDRLWQNIKALYAEVQPWNEQERTIILEKNRPPEWLTQYAADLQYTKTAITAYTVAINILSGQTQIQAQNTITTLESALTQLNPHWRDIQTLLAAPPPAPSEQNK